MLELHKIIRLSHVVVCLIVFILFYAGGVFKVMKNDEFLVFLANWVLFPKFGAGLKENYVKTAQIKLSFMCSCVRNCFYFVL